MFGKGYIFAVIKGFFKLIFAGIILFVVGILLWRFSEATPADDLMTISPNKRLVEAYKNSGNTLTLFTQKQNTITRTEDNYGYFSVVNTVFIPEINQLQILVRYNDSTLKALAEDYPEDFAYIEKGKYPDSSMDWYDISVLISRDITPENKEDNLISDRNSVELVRVLPTEVSKSVHEGRYSYRRLIFDNVSIDELTLAVYADFYYCGDVGYQREDFDVYSDRAYGTLCLYTYIDGNVDVKLTKNDIEVLNTYK